MNRKIRWQLPPDMQIIDGSVLKIVAVITMLIDHVAAGILLPMMNFGALPESLPYPDATTLYWTMRHIGRFAFPIYCFLLVEGLMYTRSRKKYALRLLAFAIISEIPFDLALIVRSAYGNTFSLRDIWAEEFNLMSRDQNVFWTLLIGMLVIWAMDTVFKKTSRFNTSDTKRAMVMAAGYIGAFLIIAAGFYAAWVLKTDYSYRGIILIVILYLLRTFRPLAIGIGYAYIAIVGYTEEWALPGFILMLLYNGKRGFIRGKAKYFFYAFYPVHLFLIYVVRAILL